jgi:hypothetical protein
MAKDRKPLIASSTMSEKERALAAMRAINQSTEEEDDKKDFHRYNIEIPSEFFEEIKDFIKEQGYNLKGFFLAAAKEKIRKEKGDK